MKYWIKTVTGEKIEKDVLAENDEAFEMESFITLLQETCHALDVPTPIFSQTNFEYLSCFNSVRLKPRDFVETVDFDYLEIEAVKEP